MRLLVVAMTAAALMVPAVPAYSQMGGSSSIAKPMPKAQEEKKKDELTPEQKKAQEKAYKDAITRIPDQKFDPWGKVR
jgi:hypothetical protein